MVLIYDFTVKKNVYVHVRDQFIEHVLDSSLCRELKQNGCVPTHHHLAGAAARGDQMGEKKPPCVGARSRSLSLPAAYGFQQGIQGSLSPAAQVAAQGPSLRLRSHRMRQQIVAQRKLNENCNKTKESARHLFS